ncbi:MAG: FAD-binding oxidoreductase [Vicinamibacterales bacterium]
MAAGSATAEIVTPADGPQLAAALHAAATERKATVISGGGTKIDWGRTASRIDLVIRTSKLTHVTHRFGDLTATIGAGATLLDVNRELAQHGQWLPIDSAFDGATIGGIIATNDAGPLRHFFGTARDRVLGVTLAMTDGRLVKAGGTVVKNVAGYDLGRLVSGSFGTLAAIESATFKVAPLPAVSGSVRIRFVSREALHQRAQALAESPLELMAFDVHAAFTRDEAVYHLLVRVASTPVATATQLEAARAMTGTDADVLCDGEEAELWRNQVRDPWTGTGAVVRLSWRPADLSSVLALLQDMQHRVEVPIVMTGRIGTGAGTVRIDGAAPAQVAAIQQLRSASLLGNVVVLRADPVVKDTIDVWGPMGSSARVMDAIKRKLDPAGILNAGRGPI